jgi:hypothetical protein
VVKGIGLFLSLLALLAAAPEIGAADYRFNVTQLKAELAIQADSTVDLHYQITFAADPGSLPIDVIDIGMPNGFYRKETANASLDGLSLSGIRDSEYVHPGVEVHLGDRPIAPGASGTLDFSIRVDNMIFPDAKDGNSASLQFQTTWYGKSYVSGNAEQIEIRINFPPGATPGAVRYHSFGRSEYAPTESNLRDNRVTYLWRWVGQPANIPYTVGVAFPKSLVASLYSPPKISILHSLGRTIASFFGFLFSLSPIWIFIVVLLFALIRNRRRMNQYLPPRIGIESGGIKHGLTPPEAALLAELPLTRVLLLVIFGLLKKDLLTVREIKDKDFRFDFRGKEGGELRDYETDFVTAIDGDKRLDRAVLKTLFTRMIKSLQKKMEGFSQRETNMYYRSIMNKAWEQVRTAPQEKLPEELAGNLEWLVLDERYESRMNEMGTGDLFFPGRGTWWYYNLPHRTSASGTGASGGTSGSISQAANRLVTSIESFSSSLVGNVGVFTTSVTQVTNPPPVRTSSGGSGGHGGGCACACACAGCACACAGGGR